MTHNVTPVPRDTTPGETSVIIVEAASGAPALARLFAALAPAHASAFVVTQIAGADRPLLPEALQALTPLPVLPLADAMTFSANHIYLAPPGRHVALDGQRLRLAGWEAGRAHDDTFYHQAFRNSPIVVARVDEELRYEWIFNPHPDFNPADLIGKRDDELEATPGVAALLDLKQRVWASGRQDRREIAFARSDGDHTYDVTASPVRDATGRVVAVVTTALDVTQRKRAEEELRRREELQAFLLRLSDALQSLVAPGTVERTVSRLLAEHLGVDRAYYFTVDADSGALIIHEDYAAGDLESLAGTYPPHIAASTVEGMRRGRPVVVDDLQELAAPAPREYDHALVRQVQSFIAAPVHRENRLVAALAVAQRLPRAWTPGEVALVAETAERAWDAVQRARAAAALQESEERYRSLSATLEQRVRARTRQVGELAAELTLAEQEERDRVGRILHDGLQQQLYGIQLQLMLLQGACEEDDKAAVAAQLAEIQDELGRALDITRQLSVDLSPAILHDEGLTDALRWLVTQMAEQHRLEVTLEADHAFPIADKGLRVLLFQTVRELLFNVVKHAGARHASVRLAQEGSRVRITVGDDGRGFDVAALTDKRDRGSGLTTIHHRLRLVGGELQIRSAPGGGTRVSVVAPLQIDPQ